MTVSLLGVCADDDPALGCPVEYINLKVGQSWGAAGVGRVAPEPQRVPSPFAAAVEL